MKIYTKTGDEGETSLCNGGRVLKNAVVVEANGAVDECNSALGVVVSLLTEDEEIVVYIKQLQIIQHLLFDLGTIVYSVGATGVRQKNIKEFHFQERAATILEQWIDAMEATLPPLKNFILPGGHQAVAMIHHARSICRRAERRLVALHLEHPLPTQVLAFINRLSDYLFVLSRKICILTKSQELLWQVNPLQEKL